MLNFFSGKRNDCLLPREGQDPAWWRLESGRPLKVCKTALLERVMRGYYGFSAAEIASALNHLLALPHVSVEDRDAVRQALAHRAAGLDLADALHHASYRDCDAMASFDDPSSPVGRNGWD